MQNLGVLQFTAEKTFQKLFDTANKKDEAIALLNTIPMIKDEKISSFSIQDKTYNENDTQISIIATTDTNKTIPIHITFSTIPGMLERAQKRFSMLLAKNTGPQENNSQQYESAIYATSLTNQKEGIVTIRLQCIYK